MTSLLPAVLPAPAAMIAKQRQFARRVRSLNLDKLSDADAVDAFCGVVNSLLGAPRNIYTRGEGSKAVQVRWSSPDSPGPSSDHKTRTVSIPWPGPEIDPDKYLALRGYALHETGRMLGSHPELMERLKKNGGDNAVAVATQLEDNRIARYCVQEFHRTYTDAQTAIAEQCKPTPEQQAEFQLADPPTKLLNDLTVKMRGLDRHGYELTSDTPVRKRLADWLTKARLGDLPIDPFADSRTKTASAQLIADRTEDFLKTFKDIFDQAEKKDPEDQQGDGEGDGEGEGQGQGKPGQGGSGGGSSRSMAQQMQQACQSDADKTQFHQTFGDGPSESEQEVSEHEGQETGTSNDANRHNAHIPDFPGPVEVLRRRGARIASQLRRSLAAKSRFGDQTDMDDGELDPEKLPDVARGKWDNPYMAPGRIIHDRDTAVSICLDGSGSMDSPGGEGGEFHRWVQSGCPSNDSQFRSALEEMHAASKVGGRVENNLNRLLQSRVWVSGATLAIHDALRSSRIAHEVTAFAGPYVQLKSWKQRTFMPAVSKEFLDGGYACGGTPAGRAWKNALGSLIKRRESRRILIVMSDGSIPGDEVEIGRAVINMARDIGIEVYGLGIMSNGIAAPFPKRDKSVSIVHFGEDLNRRMQDLVHGILTKAGQG